MDRPKILSEDLVHDTPFLTVTDRRWRAAAGDGRHTIISLKRQSAGGLPVDDAGFVYLVRQYRHGLQRETLEAPGGVVDAGEDPRDAALRETEEELGVRAAQARHLFTLHPMPSIAYHTHHLYLLTGLAHVGADPEPGEETRLHRLPLDEAAAGVGSGLLVEPFTIAALLRAAALLGV